MPFLYTLNTVGALSAQERKLIIDEFNDLRSELDDVRTQFAALLAKLDADTGVTDADYASTLALAAAALTQK
jgi:hypothetical protein